MTQAAFDTPFMPILYLSFGSSALGRLVSILRQSESALRPRVKIEIRN